MRILLVEDDAIVADVVASGLREAGFTVDRVDRAEHADLVVRSEHVDAIVLDIGLPGIDGLEWLRRLRRRDTDGQRTPVLILTARDGLDDRVDGLNFGADDYMVKPFQMPELVARCRALIRRTGSAVTSAGASLGDLSLDPVRHELRCRGRLVDLTPREWSILEYLVLHAGGVVSKDKLLRSISGWDDSMGPNAIEVYVSRLRAKLDGAGVIIRTVRGVGYRIEEVAAARAP